MAISVYLEAVIGAKIPSLVEPSATGSSGDVCVAADMAADLVSKMAPAPACVR